MNIINLKKIRKIIFISVSVLIIQIIIANSVMAAGVSINVNSTATVGEPISISVSGSGAQWGLTILVNGSRVESDSNTSGIDEKNISFSTSYTPTESDVANGLNISLEGSVTNTDGSTERDFSSRTVSVNNKSTPDTPSSEPEESKIPTESSSSSSTEEQEEKSSNNYLESLSVSEGKLTPSFDRATTEYTVEFPDDFDWKKLNSINISAKKEHDKASISGTGETSLNDGDNTLEIKVTAENGSVRTYTIKIKKPETIKQSDLRLKSLEISKIDKDNKFTKAKLNKDFDPAVFEYTLDVGSDITSLDVDAKVEKEGIVVSVEGEKNLKSGKNDVKIILKAKDDPDVKTTYLIKVNKEAEKTAGTNEEKKDNGSGLKGVIIGIVIFIVILAGTLVTLLIINHKRKKAESIEYSKKAKKPSRNFVDFDIYDDDDKTDKDEIDDEIKSEEIIEDDDTFEDARLSGEAVKEEFIENKEDDIDTENENDTDKTEDVEEDTDGEDDEFEDAKLDENDITEEKNEKDEEVEEIENTKAFDDEYKEEIKKATEEPEYDDWEDSSFKKKKDKKGKGKRFL